MRVLLSIKPEFASKIFSGEKRYEYRRSIFKNNQVKTVVVYASSPVQRVIGEIEIDRILCDEVENLWDKTKRFGGITEDYFYEYFTNKEKGYAIKIKFYKKYEESLSIEESFNIKPPQSFAYVK